MPMTCGIDWAEGHHDIALIDDNAVIVARTRIDTGAAGFGALLALVAEHGGSPEDTPIAIETDKNLLVVALSEAGFTMYPINPRAVARYRERHGQAGGKSDPGDAAVLAHILRTDRPMHRPLAAVSEQGRAVKALARQHQEAIWALHQMVSRLRSVLLEFYPQALQAFSNLQHRAATTILAAVPTPAAAARLTRVRVIALLKQCGRRNDPTLVEQILTDLKSAALRQPSRVEEALGHTVIGQIRIITAMQQAVDELEAEMEREFASHPQAPILRSAPGLGPILAARLLSEIGDDPKRFADANSLKAFAGTAPVTVASGRSRFVKARKVRNKRLGDACHSGHSPHSPNRPVPAPTTTNARPLATATTPPCATSPTNSSVACGGAWSTTNPGTNTAPGLTTTTIAKPPPLDNSPAWDVYLNCGEGDMFLCAIRDGNSRRVLGHVVAEHIGADMVCQAIDRAVATRSRPVTGAVLHSDRGGEGEFTAALTAKACHRHGLRRSMGETGICWDNSPTESFWSTFSRVAGTHYGVPAPSEPYVPVVPAYGSSTPRGRSR
ncbi:IS110 family transposase [Nocardia sp. KC 131]|uniref:IS110 family transposase n=1 Tax=Nocardia arseniciresistens TaxID=3392119 RepID=UPI00398E4971